MKKRLSFMFVVTILSICTVAVAEEEVLWCEQAPLSTLESAFDEPETAMSCDCYNDCYSWYMSNVENICTNEMENFCYELGYNQYPLCLSNPSCSAVWLQDCARGSGYGIYYNCIWDWVNNLINMHCHSACIGACE